MDLSLTCSIVFTNAYTPQTNQMDQLLNYNKYSQKVLKKTEGDAAQEGKDKDILHFTINEDRKIMHTRSHFKQNGSEGKHYMRLIKDCMIKRDLRRGKKLHAEISELGLLETDAILGTALISMYAKCGKVEASKEVFDKLPIRDVVSWTALIAGHAEHGYAKEALAYFDKMRAEGIIPNPHTFVCGLNACACIGT